MGRRGFSFGGHVRTEVLGLRGGVVFHRVTGMKSDDKTHWEEPNVKALFYGGPCDGWEIYLAKAYAEFCPVVPVKDENGQVLKRQIVKYRLDRTGPPLLFVYVCSTDLAEPTA